MALLLRASAARPPARACTTRSAGARAQASPPAAYGRRTAAALLPLLVALAAGAARAEDFVPTKLSTKASPSPVSARAARPSPLPCPALAASTVEASHTVCRCASLRPTSCLAANRALLSTSPPATLCALTRPLDYRCHHGAVCCPHTQLAPGDYTTLEASYKEKDETVAGARLRQCVRVAARRQTAELAAPADAVRVTLAPPRMRGGGICNRRPATDAADAASLALSIPLDQATSVALPPSPARSRWLWRS